MCFCRPGQYAHLNVPAISFAEWHPFTITSVPSDNFIMFHIQSAGDWTAKLHECIAKQLVRGVHTQIASVSNMSFSAVKVTSALPLKFAIGKKAWWSRLDLQHEALDLPPLPPFSESEAKQLYSFFFLLKVA